MSASPPGGEGRGGARRILPSVSEVAAALGQLVPADTATLYRAAREVVAEELGRVKQGLESAPLELLVERAQTRIRVATRELPLPKDQPDLFGEAPPEPAPKREAVPEPPMPVLPTLYEAPEAPFSAASSAELGWDRPAGDGPETVLVAPETPVTPPPTTPERLRAGVDLSFPDGTAPEEPGTELHPPEAADVEMRELDEALAAAEPGDEAARRRLWILAVAAFAVVAAGVVWLVLRILSPASGVVRSEGPARVEVPAAPVLPSEPAPAAVAPAPTPAPTPAPARPPVPAAPSLKTSPAKPAAARPEPSRTSPVAVFTTKDWAGRSPVFIVHFSSHQERSAASSEAARLGAAFGKPARAVAVDLGARGIWYRVVVGEFRSADEARAFRAGLAAKKTPGMGFVYEMRGPR